MAVDDRFEAPGPGMWNLDRSHFPGGTTPMSKWLMEGCPTGMRRAFEEIGMPAETLDVRFVRGFMYHAPAAADLPQPCRHEASARAPAEARRPVAPRYAQAGEARGACD